MNICVSAGKAYTRVPPVWLILFPIVFNACITTVKHEGSWYNAPDLRISPSSLEGSGITVTCTKGRTREASYDLGKTKACTHIGNSLQEAGATIRYGKDSTYLKPGQVAEEELEANHSQGKNGEQHRFKTEYNLTYLELGGETQSYFNWTLYPAIFTLSFFPYVIEGHVYAEVNLSDDAGMDYRSYPLKVSFTRYIGLVSLWVWINRIWVSKDRVKLYYKNLGPQLLNHVLNIAYTHHKRLMIEK